MKLNLILSAILLVVLSGTPSVSAVAPNNVVRVRDYARGDCSADDTAAVRAAINAWLTQQAARTAGILDFGSGCYAVNAQGGTALSIARSGGFVGGEIRGDGPDLTTIRVTAGTARGMELDDFVNGRVHGFSIDGGSSNRTGMGLVLAARHRDLGTCCSTFENVKVQGFGHCFQLGDDAAPYGAAAELVMVNTTAQYCGSGFYFTQFNSIDFLLDKPAVLFSSVGFDNNVAQGIRVRGGSAHGNVTDFRNGAVTKLVIEGFRSEPDTGVTRGPTIILQNNSTQYVTIRDSDLFVTTTAVTTPAISATSGGVMLSLEHNTFSGPISIAGNHNTIMSRGNVYRSVGYASPFKVQGASDNLLISEGDAMPGGGNYGFGLRIAPRNGIVP